MQHFLVREKSVVSKPSEAEVIDATQSASLVEDSSVKLSCHASSTWSSVPPLNKHAFCWCLKHL